jgi:hypothetical protein
LELLETKKNWIEADSITIDSVFLFFQRAIKSPKKAGVENKTP